MPNALANWVLPTVTIERLADAREKGDLLLVPFKRLPQNVWIDRCHVLNLGQRSKPKARNESPKL